MIEYASGIGDAARLTYTLCMMSEDEAKSFSISPEERFSYVRVDSAKVNTSPEKGFFTVVTGLAGTVWKNAVRRLDLPFLRIVVTGSPETQDLYCEWQRAREIEPERKPALKWYH